MLDIKFIRENKDLIASAAQKKHIVFDVEELLKVDDKRRALIGDTDGLKAEQKLVSDEVQKAEGTERERKIKESKQIKEKIQGKEEELKEVMKEWQSLMVRVPNIPDFSVPEGKDDTENKEAYTRGEKPVFSFTPKSHVELMRDLDLADFERGTKVAGFRGYILKNEGARLSFAIWQFTMEHLAKKGFIPLLVPSLVKRETLLGSGYLPQGEEDLYRTQDGDYLAGTGEVASMGYYMDEVLDKADLPKKFIAFSPCFRREAGSHGKDTKGLIRVHEFFKLEQLVLSEASHEESVKLHEELTVNSEEILEALGLPYRRVLICGGDLGLGQVKKYDLEAWVPSENTYRETHSSSYFHDFQTRRLNIRYKDTDGTMRFAHSLNNTAIATPRAIVSIIENYQQADGTVKIPEVLQKYMGTDVIRKKS